MRISSRHIGSGDANVLEHVGHVGACEQPIISRIKSRKQLIGRDAIAHFREKREGINELIAILIEIFETLFVV